MPGLIRAGAVDPPVKPAKSGRAGLCARFGAQLHRWHRLSSRFARTGKLPVPP
jgi:hypothetical protein